MSHAAPDEPRADEPQADEPEEVPTESLLVVVAGERLFALPLEAVREVVTARPYAPVPGAPPAVRGVVNVRGRVVTVVDLGAALRLEPTAAAADHRLLVVEHAGRGIGVAVRDVARILAHPLDELVPPAEGSESGWVRATGRMDGREIEVLDADALLHSILS